MLKLILFICAVCNGNIVLNNTNHATILGTIDDKSSILFASQVLNQSNTIQYQYDLILDILSKYFFNIYLLIDKIK